MNNVELAPNNRAETKILEPLEPLESLGSEFENELTEALTLSEIRQLHIEWIKGNYWPSSDILKLILDDKGFYESDEFIHYEKQEMDKIAEQNADIYAPPMEKIKATVKPFIELIGQDMGELVKLGDNLSEELSEDNFLEVIRFFAQKYNLRSVPSVMLKHEDSAGGSYDAYHNRITVTIDEHTSIANYLDTVAHETWHACQHERENENEDYRANHEHYYRSCVDYDAYQNQLVEKEAFVVGINVGRFYRVGDLVKHPERIPVLQKKYSEYCNGMYDPFDNANRGKDMDCDYLLAAHDEFPESA